ncbi:hypothetical protein DSO57_1003371 [Entomophthora muscae]|uniref:Uncharacterized protein n=1 Tax=Entomophthora muscae TaxID=34485 RepID=A0ACC2SXP3_9FUNG|nr:hypothetical protein DSO57_1003371 [Entomophthora muscae]
MNAYTIISCFCLLTAGAVSIYPAVGDFDKSFLIRISGWEFHEPYHIMEVALDTSSIAAVFLIYPTKHQHYKITGHQLNAAGIKINKFNLDDTKAAKLKLVSLDFKTQIAYTFSKSFKLLISQAIKKNHTVYFNINDQCISNINIATVGDSNSPAPLIQIIKPEAPTPAPVEPPTNKLVEQSKLPEVLMPTPPKPALAEALSPAKNAPNKAANNQAERQ